jgi:hypothetical protein
VRAGYGPAGRLRPAVRGWQGRARPWGASRCGLSRPGLPVLPPAARAVRARTVPGLRAAGRGSPRWAGLGAAHRPVCARAWRGPRAARCLAAAGRVAAVSSRAAVAGRGMGLPVRRAVATPCRLVRAPPCRLVRAPPRGLVRAAIGAAPRGLIRARNRRRTVLWCLLAGHLRRNRAVWQLAARTGARGPAVLQVRIAHGASVFLLGARHGAVRHFSWPRRLVTRPRDGCPHLGCSPGYPHGSRGGANPGPGPAARPGRRPRDIKTGHAGAYRMPRFAVPAAGRYPYLTSMSIGMPTEPRATRGRVAAGAADSLAAGLAQGAGPEQVPQMKAYDCAHFQPQGR